MKVMEEEIVRVLTNNTQNNTWTLDSDMSQLVSNSEEEVVVETQIILQQPALPQLIFLLGEDKKKNGQLESIMKKRLQSMYVSKKTTKQNLRILRNVESYHTRSSVSFVGTFLISSLRTVFMLLDILLMST
jgi:hypothetical protein